MTKAPWAFQVRGSRMGGRLQFRERAWRGMVKGTDVAIPSVLVLPHPGQADRPELHLTHDEAAAEASI